jgi:outer membrane protein OmpA-like peptidoglycan-associated protein
MQPPEALVNWQISFGGPTRPRLGDTISLFGKSRRPTDSDSDGLADERDRCPFEAEDADRFQDEDGCIDTDNDRDGIPDIRDSAPNQAETPNGFRDEDGLPDTPPPHLEWRTGMIRTLTLQRNSVALTREAQGALDVAVQVLKDYPDLRVDVSHSDDRGQSVNRLVAEQRANRVRMYLAHGWQTSVWKRRAMVPSDPLITRTEDARSRNRRVEMVFRK